MQITFSSHHCSMLTGTMGEDEFQEQMVLFFFVTRTTTRGGKPHGIMRNQFDSSYTRTTRLNQEVHMTIILLTLKRVGIAALRIIQEL